MYGIAVLNPDPELVDKLSLDVAHVQLSLDAVRVLKVKTSIEGDLLIPPTRNCQNDKDALGSA
jgi:hypothetical protein